MWTSITVTELFWKHHSHSRNLVFGNLQKMVDGKIIFIGRNILLTRNYFLPKYVSAMHGCTEACVKFTCHVWPIVHWWCMLGQVIQWTSIYWSNCGLELKILNSRPQCNVGQWKHDTDAWNCHSQYPGYLELTGTFGQHMEHGASLLRPSRRNWYNEIYKS